MSCSSLSRLHCSNNLHPVGRLGLLAVTLGSPRRVQRHKRLLTRNPAASYTVSRNEGTDSILAVTLTNLDNFCTSHNFGMNHPDNESS